MKAIIFDIDGTLYSDEKPMERGLSAVCKYAQDMFSIPETEFSEAYKKYMKVMAAELGPQAAIHSRAIRFQRILEERNLSLNHVDILDELYWNTLIQSSCCEPGLEQAMADLKQAGYILGVGSNMTLDWQIKKLKALGLIDYFTFVVTSEEAGVEKPHKGLFDLCAKKAGVTSAECIFVGDSLKNDVIGAENAGMTAIWYAPGREDFLDHSGITHYDQLMELVKKLSSI